MEINCTWVWISGISEFQVKGYKWLMFYRWEVYLNDIINRDSKNNKWIDGRKCLKVHQKIKIKVQKLESKIQGITTSFKSYFVIKSSH